MRDDDSTISKSAGRQSCSIWIGLGLAIALDTVMPLIWKTAMMRLPGSAGIEKMVAAVFSQPLFAIVLVIFFLQFFNWMAVLANADVSYAQPITSASYVTVMILSVICFGEHITLLRGLGVGLILAGVCFVSSTPANTSGIARTSGTLISSCGQEDR